MDIGQLLTLEIDDLAFGGDGVGHLDDGRAVFVPFSAVGDELEVRVNVVHARYARAEIVQTARPGPGRCEPACRHYGRCGGCRYQHLDYATETAAKLAQLKAVLARVGRFATLPDVTPIVHSEQEAGYRNKLRVEPFDPSPESAGESALAYGYCEMDNNTFFALDSCPLAAPALNALLPKAQRSAWAHKNARRLHPQPLTLRLTSEGTTHFYFGHAPRRIPWLHETLCGRPLSVPLGSFWQVNSEVAAQLVDTITAWFDADPTPVLVDAYSGVGPFSLALGERPERRVLVDRTEQSLQAAAYNHEQWGLAKCRFICGPAERVLRRILSEVSQGDARVTLVLDPPRSGCGAGVIAALAAHRVAQVIYVSCNAATLARDCRRLCDDAGFSLSQLAFFDMFPRTAHFEAAALLRW